MILCLSVCDYYFVKNPVVILILCLHVRFEAGHNICADTVTKPEENSEKFIVPIKNKCSPKRKSLRGGRIRSPLKNTATQKTDISERQIISALPGSISPNNNSHHLCLFHIYEDRRTFQHSSLRQTHNRGVRAAIRYKF